MEDEKSDPESAPSDQPGAPKQTESPGTPPPSAIPAAGVLAGADEEKAAMVEQAKSRVAAGMTRINWSRMRVVEAWGPKNFARRSLSIPRMRIACRMMGR